MGNLANETGRPSLELPAAREASPRVGSDALPVGLRVEEVLRASSLHGAEVVAGGGGLGRLVRRLNVMEVPDILPWVKPDELLLTTGYPLRHDAAGLAALVADLDERGLAALAVKRGRYLEALPEDMLAEADRRGFPVIALPRHIGFDEVINQVLTDVLNRQAAVLARSEEVHRALVRVVLDGGGLPEVASELVALLGGAVMMTTPDGRVLVEAGAVEDVAAAQTSECFDASGRFRTERERVGLHGHGGSAANHVVVAVVAGGVDHGRIVAYSPTGERCEGDVDVVERAATVAALAVTKQLAVSAVESKYQGHFLRDLLAGRVPADQAVHQAASLGWDIDRSVVVLVAQLDPAAGAAAVDAGVPLRPVQERFALGWETVVRPRDPRAPVAGFSQEVVAVLGVPGDGDVDRMVRDVVARVAGDGGGGRRSFSTGVSRVTTAAGLPQAYEHARKAVHVGRRMHGPGAVAHFDELGVFRLLSLVDDTAELRDFMTETLGELVTRDDAEAADLTRTLEVLLETNLNVAETARVLHFHYNTLRYRIAKLERLVGPFTSDPNLRLNLLLALAVRRMRGV